jgi:glycosyltransferase involved in cell wall biosynthesis
VSQPTDAGVGRVVALLAADQVSRGWNVSVASPPGRLAHDVRAAGAAWLAWPARRGPGPGTLSEALRLRRIVASARPDAVHLHSSKAGLAGRCVVRGRTPTIFEPHAWSFHAVGGPVRRLTVRWERVAVRWTTAIVCVSDAERAEGEREGIVARYHVIPNGVDTARVRVAEPADRVAARARLGIPADVPFAVCIGRLSHQKGQDVLLQAWPAVRAAFPAARLALVGDGPLHEQLARGAPLEVMFAGHREDIDDWLAAADVAVMPSRWEGMSLALLEAMARGRSVVAADVAGARDALGQASSAVVPVESPTELAAAVVARLADPALASAEGAANRTLVEGRFSLARLYDAVAALTAQLASPP